MSKEWLEDEWVACICAPFTDFYESKGYHHINPGFDGAPAAVASAPQLHSGHLSINQQQCQKLRVHANQNN